MSDTDAAKSLDGFLGGRLLLRQPRQGHRAGHDAMLLAASTNAKSGDRVVEFGAGVGAAGLAVAARVAGVDLALCEINGQLCELASANAAANKIVARVVPLDVTAPASDFANAALAPDSADIVLMNPPFNDPLRHRASTDPDRARAHVAADTTVEAWIHAARRLLRPQGSLTLIWRADALADVVTALARGFGAIRIQAVHSNPDQPAIRILVRAVKGSRAPLRIEPGLVVTSDAVCRALAEARALPLAHE
jgi:tRNA1(Val) A37 N6-methylase TrmN6